MSLSLPLSQRWYDLLIISYFLLHIPLTLFVDSQAVFPREHYPQVFRQMLDDWIRDYDDQLMKSPPAFIKAYVALALFTHIPFFLVATVAFIKGHNYIRLPTIIYGISTATTVVASIAEAWVRFSPHTPMTTRYACLSVYALWMVIPLLLVVRAWNDNMFGQQENKKKKA